jgi:hypothetical protein
MQTGAPSRYDAWLVHVFDRPLSHPAWYFELDAADFEATAQELVALVAHTLRNSGTDLARFSDEQVSEGLHYLFNNACSNVVFTMMDAAVPVATRKAAIASIKALYAGVFERRCAPVLGHRDEPGARPLNQICYMLWDISPLGYWEASREKETFYPAVLEVLEYALASRNIACVESALHGLGHLRLYRPREVTPMIADFVRANPGLRPELLRYAENAAAGCIQ